MDWHCRRLIAAGGLPDRAGLPTQIMLHMGLDQLRGEPGVAGEEAAWGAAAAHGDECDVSVVPVVTGRVAPDILGRLALALLDGMPARPGLDHPGPDQPGPAQPAQAGPAGPGAPAVSPQDVAAACKRVRAERRAESGRPAPRGRS